jgi:hypothetical protein
VTKKVRPHEQRPRRLARVVEAFGQREPETSEGVTRVVGAEHAGQRDRIAAPGERGHARIAVPERELHHPKNEQRKDLAAGTERRGNRALGDAHRDASRLVLHLG